MYVDIHSHIVPAVDDGAGDNRAAVEILRMAYQNGTAHIIATPHFITGLVENDSRLIHEKCMDIQSLACNEEIYVTIHPGSEVFISPDIPELFDKGIICTLNDSFYILIELPMDGIPIYTDDVLYSLQLKGLVPIIAHPERNREIQKNPDILVNLVKRGVLAQANSGSITGLYGREIRNVVLKYIKMGLYQFVASDAHTCRGRSPKLMSAAAIVQKEFGQEMAESLFFRNGITVLENGIVPVYVKEDMNSYKGFLGTLIKKCKINKGGNCI